MPLKLKIFLRFIVEKKSSVFEAKIKVCVAATTRLEKN